VAGLEWADSLGAEVVSTSLGYLSFDDGFSYWPQELDGRTAVTSRAAAWLVRRGIVLVTAMGNEGRRGPQSLITPADAESVISVGAVDSRGQLAGFSSRGPNALGVIKPDVCARGEGTACATAASNNAYTAVNGTSLSTPLIGGLAALLLEAHPDWTPWQVQQALHAAGDQARAPESDRGWGVPDGAAALGALDPEAAELSVEAVSWVDEERPGEPVFQDSLASPGESGRLRLRLSNDGENPTRPCWLALAVPPEGVLVGSDSVFVDALAPGSRYTVESGPEVTISAEHAVPRLVRLAVRVRTDRAGIYYRTLDIAVVSSSWQLQPHPNPLLAGQELILDVDRTAPGPVSVSLFDVTGKLVAEPFTGFPAPSRARLRWTPGEDLPSGVYFLRVEAGNGAEHRRIVLIR
jgi:hypothetical protein